MDKSIYSKQYNSFLELMIASRKAAGITQTELANRLNKPQSFVSKYEHGERRLDVIEFLHICRSLAIDPSGILRKLK